MKVVVFSTKDYDKDSLIAANDDLATADRYVRNIAFLPLSYSSII
jgi:hypothetical protein